MDDDDLTPSPLSHRAIRKYARLVGEHHDVFPEVPGRTDLDGLIEHLGGAVVTSRALTDVTGLSVLGPGEFVIHQPQLTSVRRRRFHLARAVGHYVLHYLHLGETGPMHVSRDPGARASAQANVFASALLMPQEQFEQALHDCDGNSWAVADIFEVSPAAVDARARELKTLAHHLERSSRQLEELSMRERRSRIDAAWTT